MSLRKVIEREMRRGGHSIEELRIMEEKVLGHILQGEEIFATDLVVIRNLVQRIDQYDPGMVEMLWCREFKVKRYDAEFIRVNEHE